MTLSCGVFMNSAGSVDERRVDLHTRSGSAFGRLLLDVERTSWLEVSDIEQGNLTLPRAIVMQQKTKRLVENVCRHAASFAARFS